MLNIKQSRREFLTYCSKIAALLGGGVQMSADFAEAFMKITQKQPPVIWMTGQACTGDSVSLVYSDSPSLVPFLSTLIDLKFHPALSVAQGEVAIDIIEEQKNAGGYILCFEGAIPMQMPGACKFNEKFLSDYLYDVVKKAFAVIACGTCASYGGIPAANPETGAISIAEYVKQKGLSTPVVRIPGCPMNAHRFTGTVAYFLAYNKLPQLDEDGRPVLYYGKTNHDNCQRFPYFAQDKCLTDYSEKSLCLYRMGCKGPVTKSDCPVRRWNKETSWCVASNTPCVGCTNPEWPWPKDTGIYRDPKKILPEENFIQETIRLKKI